MKISCIIPAYNPENITRLLDSIKENSKKPFEVIIVDDASINSFEIKEDEFVIVRNDKNLGPSGSRNRGAHRAAGEILVFLDCDILIPENLFSKIDTFFHENSEFDLWSGSFSEYSCSTNISTKYKSSYMRAIHDEAPKDANFVLGACVAVKKKDFISWPSEMRFAEDSFWAHQYIYLYGKRIYFDRNTRVDHYKKYIWKNWLKNDFEIAAGMVCSFLSFYRSRKERSFSHVSNKQKVAVLLAPAAIISFVFGLNILAISCTALWLMTSLELIFRISKYSRLNLVLVLILFFINSLAHFSGIVFGTIKFISVKNRKLLK